MATFDHVDGFVPVNAPSVVLGSRVFSLGSEGADLAKVAVFDVPSKSVIENYTLTPIGTRDWVGPWGVAADGCAWFSMGRNSAIGTWQLWKVGD